MIALIRSGANVNVINSLPVIECDFRPVHRDDTFITPLWLAMALEHHDIAKILMGQGEAHPRCAVIRHRTWLCFAQLVLRPEEAEQYTVSAEISPWPFALGGGGMMAYQTLLQAIGVIPMSSAIALYALGDAALSLNMLLQVKATVYGYITEDGENVPTGTVQRYIISR